jgi:alkane 1-monooxygenase
MNPISFFSFLIFTAITVFGVLADTPYSTLPILFVFIGIPLIDFLRGVDKSNPSHEEERSWKQTKVWAPALYLYALTHFTILIFTAYQVLSLTSWNQIIILGIVVGLYTGGLGITVGHELCHKKEKLARFVADLLLASVWYQHFAVEHVKGHHLSVSTPDDPASARKDENVYRFLFRTITGSFIHALQIDPLAVIKGLILAIAFTFLAAYLGKNTLVFFIIQSMVAIVLLELVNYVEHYGLSRKQLANGRYEKVQPIHSWNSAHKFSNLILFNLQRHSDHHAAAHLPYTILKHQEDAPQLPSGYPGMILLALIPPLWFKLMNPIVQSWENKGVQP